MGWGRKVLGAELLWAGGYGKKNKIVKVGGGARKNVFIARYLSAILGKTAGKTAGKALAGGPPWQQTNPTNSGY